ncbi:hypothetical protein PsYK624_068830 [Phanerochaete sordida]|uniref:Uncharacterized protein n=1 Tax=Phanerochaete sordida TaxID=48140 RepID=A0A9P3GBC7_9APHY|nr:hypothetical protein PsYK624_068830 [Phanerochaete sordida]
MHSGDSGAAVCGGTAWHTRLLTAGKRPDRIVGATDAPERTRTAYEHVESSSPTAAHLESAGSRVGRIRWRSEGVGRASRRGVHSRSTRSPYAPPSACSQRQDIGRDNRHPFLCPPRAPSDVRPCALQILSIYPAITLGCARLHCVHRGSSIYQRFASSRHYATACTSVDIFLGTRAARTRATHLCYPTSMIGASQSIYQHTPDRPPPGDASSHDTRRSAPQ